ncbi:ABC transporter substrate-binding protein [Aureimonas mangrovi]|uniref:ABC transporter substrate-binding protein n=1 Tax=Aureimonas mangrovi TaxID=2758041 RepID=UPI00163D7E7C|nr:ABC transporter substrate-binding protein [Aureimonas mangrovi]
MTFRTTLLAAALMAGAAMPAAAQTSTLRIGLAEDPDLLDPHRSRTFVGRIVYASMCDRLIDITPELDFAPALATDWSWNEGGTELTFNLRKDAVFHDGEPFNAEAVKANIERAQTLPDSLVRTDIAAITGVEVVDEYTVRLLLDEPDATLLAQISDRAGIMMSPASFEQEGNWTPVCSGPYQFETRVQNDRIVLSKFDDHYAADDYSFDEVVFLPIPDGTVRLANLQSGDLDMLERMTPSDAQAVESNPDLQLVVAPTLGYQGIRINTNNGPAAENPLGQDKRVRQALQLAIDKSIITQVVGNDIWDPAQQPFPPASPYHDETIEPSTRDVAAARALLDEAGVDRLAFELTIATSTQAAQLGELIQAMVAEAGFDVSLRPMEFASLLAEMKAGNFTATASGWSGRVDPDGNIYSHLACDGANNDSLYCNEEVDRLLNEARRVSDVAERKALYDQAQAILQDELPLIYTYHQNSPFVLRTGVEGFTPYPDNLIRLRGMTKAQ